MKNHELIRHRDGYHHARCNSELVGPLPVGEGECGHCARLADVDARREALAHERLHDPVVGRTYWPPVPGTAADPRIA